MLSFRKKLMSQFQANLQANRWMDGRTDKPYFIGPFWPRPAVKKATKKTTTKKSQKQLNSVQSQLNFLKDKTDTVKRYIHIYILI